MKINGYDKNDPINGYSSIFEEPIISIRISDRYSYKVHFS